MEKYNLNITIADFYKFYTFAHSKKIKVMFKTIKLFAFAIIGLVIFISVSCIKSDDLPERTLATEEQELFQSIANLEKAGYDIDTTALGVYYIMNKTGNGSFPVEGDTCLLIYTGFLLNTFMLL